MSPPWFLSRLRIEGVMTSGFQVRSELSSTTFFMNEIRVVDHLLGPL